MQLINTGPVNVKGALIFDPEIRFTPSDKAVANIIIRTEDDKEIHCTFWEEMAETLAEEGRREMHISIHGEWQSRKFQDRNDQWHTINYVNVKAWTWSP